MNGGCVEELLPGELEIEDLLVNNWICRELDD